MAPIRYRRPVDKVLPARWRLTSGEIAPVLFGLAVLGVGVGLEWTGAGWGLLPVAAVLIGFAFTVAMVREQVSLRVQLRR